MIRTSVRIIITMLALTAFGCGSAQVHVTSTPSQASVFAVGPGGDEHELGKTPLEIDSAKLAEGCGSSNGPCRIMISKKGYSRESLFVTSSFLKERFDVKVALQPSAEWLDVEKSEAFTSRLNDVAHYTAKLQELTLKGEYDSAMDTARQFVSAHPKVSVAWDLLGNVYYLRRNFAQAVDAYRKSLALNPNNVQTQQIVRHLQNSRESER